VVKKKDALGAERMETKNGGSCASSGRPENDREGTCLPKEGPPMTGRNQGEGEWGRGRKEKLISTNGSPFMRSKIKGTDGTMRLHGFAWIQKGKTPSLKHVLYVKVKEGEKGPQKERIGRNQKKRPFTTKIQPRSRTYLGVTGGKTRKNSRKRANGGN